MHCTSAFESLGDSQFKTPSALPWCSWIAASSRCRRDVGDGGARVAMSRTRKSASYWNKVLESRLPEHIRVCQLLSKNAQSLNFPFLSLSIQSLNYGGKHEILPNICQILKYRMSYFLKVSHLAVEGKRVASKGKIYKRCQGCPRAFDVRLQKDQVQESLNIFFTRLELASKVRCSCV
jgi:hypothetical protein